MVIVVFPVEAEGFPEAALPDEPELPDPAHPVKADKSNAAEQRTLKSLFIFSTPLYESYIGLFVHLS